MDFQKVMTMIDDISQHIPEQKYIEIVNNLKKEYDNANDNANTDDDTDDDDDTNYVYIKILYKQLEYDLYRDIKRVILFKNDDIAIDIVCGNIFPNVKNIVFHKVNKIKNDMIWDFIQFVNNQQDRIENMIDEYGHDIWYDDNLINKNSYICHFADLALESVKWYLRQEFQTEKYIDSCWSRISENYEDAYDGGWSRDITEIQFPKDYFDGMTESEWG
jgi:hypothetical protein